LIRVAYREKYVAIIEDIVAWSRAQGRRKRSTDDSEPNLDWDALDG
jgi:hypothetical protein